MILMIDHHDDGNQIGTSSPSVSHEIATIQRLLHYHRHCIEYSMHSAGTTMGNDLIRNPQHISSPPIISNLTW